MTATNENGLTWSQWWYAAGAPSHLDKRDLKVAWRKGEDPSEYRAGNRLNRAGPPSPGSGAMTSREMGLEIVSLVGPLVYGQKFHVHNGESGVLPGVQDNVYVTWANVDVEASELDALNAEKSIMLSIDAPQWGNRIDPSMIGKTPVSKVQVRAFRGRSQRSFRGKTGTPKQVIESIYKWFVANADPSKQSKSIAKGRLDRSNMAGYASWKRDGGNHAVGDFLKEFRRVKKSHGVSNDVAARDMISHRRELSYEVIEIIGLHPSSEPELAALQRQWG